MRQALPAILVALALSAPGNTQPRATGAPGAMGRVLFPAGACTSGWLELQRWDRASADWRSEGRIPTGSCRRLPLDQLLNEVRVRCVAAAGTPLSDWVVGVSLAKGGGDGEKAPHPACPDDGEP